jgi:3-dehydroquinate dehydratase
MWFHRPKWEGGEYEGEDEPRFEALQLAMELGAEYVDIELKVGPEYNISFSILQINLVYLNVTLQ